MLQSTNKKKNNNKIWIWSALIILALLITAAIIKSKTKPKGVGVFTEKVQKRTVIETVSASGKIYPEKEIKISSDVSGEVVELYVKEGDSVKVGQILAKVNPDTYQSAVERTAAGVNAARSQAGATNLNIESAKAQRDQIKSNYTNAKKNYERNKSLLQDGIISQAELDASEATYKNLTASLAAAENAISTAMKSAEASGFQVKDAEALLKEQKTNLGRTTIKAPASGVISKLNIEKGERVVGTMQMSGTELMRIADLGAMEVQVEVSENDIITVHMGNTADIEVDAYQNRKFKGIVTEVANSASNISTNGISSLSNDQVTKFVVKVRINKESYNDLISGARASTFKPGMSATVEIKTNQVDNILTIPIQSVTAYDPNEELKKKMSLAKKDNKLNVEEEKVTLDKNDFVEAVFVKQGDTVSRIDVISGIQDENYIEIKSGLNEGDEVIIGPYSAISKELKQGSKVHIKKEDEEVKKK